MRIGVPTETAAAETRVALVPRSVAQLVSARATVAVEAGAGVAAGFTDAAYREVGAEITGDRGGLLGDAGLVAVVRRPGSADLRRLKPGAVLVGLLDPGGDPEPVKVLTAQRVTAFRLEAMPRI